MRTDIMGNKSEEPMPANQGNQFKFEAKQIDINNYVSFDILTQEHKDNTFWSIKQFFCHDMFSQRFSFPSWCFSLVMGKWFKGKCPRQGRGWHDRRGVGSCLGKTQQKAADCLKLLREAQTTSNIARLNILSSTEIFLWLGWNPFQSCACDMRGGELSMPCHLSSSCPLQAGRGLIVGLPSHSRFLGMSDARLLGNNNGTKPGKIQPICQN